MATDVQFNLEKCTSNDVCEFHQDRTKTGDTNFGITKKRLLILRPTGTDDSYKPFHMLYLDLHAILEHTDCQGLSVHCQQTQHGLNNICKLVESVTCCHSNFTTC